jgi:hypothetical protein
MSETCSRCLREKISPRIGTLSAHIDATEGKCFDDKECLSIAYEREKATREKALAQLATLHSRNAAHERWMLYASEAVSGLKPGAVTGHPVVDCVAGLKAEMAQARQDLACVKAALAAAHSRRDRLEAELALARKLRDESATATGVLQQIEQLQSEMVADIAALQAGRR